MSANIDPTTLVLHILPAKWNLPSIDPSCLAALMYLQQTIPGKFAVVECSVQDQSPTGQLPFLTHKQQSISSLGSIMRYVAGLKDSTPDVALANIEKSQTTAWCAHVESNLGDIVYNVLYSHQTNWAELTHPTLTSMYPIPQRYYIPGRIRQSYKPRLGAAGLWDLALVEEDDNKPFKGLRSRRTGDNKKTFQQAFGREKVVEKARASLDIYARLIGEGPFVFKDRPTRLDIVLAAHILLLVDPPYPDPFMQKFIKDTFPTLALHARRVYTHIYDSSNVPLQVTAAQSISWNSLFIWPTVPRKQVQESEDDIYFRRMRWGFYGLTLGSLAVYLASALAVTGHRLRLIQEAGNTSEAGYGGEKDDSD